MLKVGDKVKVIKDRSNYEPFKKYIGTIQEIENIDGFNYYLKGVYGEVNSYCPRIFYYEGELELVKEKQNISTLDNNTIALIKAMGMQAENKIRELNGEALAYNEQSFIDLIKKYEKE